MVTRNGMPTSSASLNLTPARTGRSSTMTSTPAPSSAWYTFSPASATAGSSCWAITTTTSNGAIATGQMMPLASWWTSMTEAIARSTPMP
jgi:hypothetical protein